MNQSFEGKYIVLMSGKVYKIVNGKCIELKGRWEGHRFIEGSEKRH